MGTYSGDAQFIDDAHGTVYSEIPTSEEGQDNEERWAFVDGKGLYHCKKVGGGWRYKIYNTNVLLEGEASTKNISVVNETLTQSAGVFDDVTVNNSLTVTGDSNSSFGSGNFSVSGSLTGFPTSGNLRLTPNSQLNTIQDIKPDSSPQFNSLGLGDNTAPAQAGAIDLDYFYHSGISASGIINDVLELVDHDFTNAQGTQNVNGLDMLGDDPVTKGEIDQIKNINAHVIDEATWGHVADMNQDVGTDDPVTFSNLTLTDTHTHTLDVESATGHLRVGGPSGTHWSWNDDMGLQSDTYVSGGTFNGQGWGLKLDYDQGGIKNYAFEIDDLYVRGTLSVTELLVQQIRATNGALYVSSAARIEQDGLKGIDTTNGIYELTFAADEGNDKGHPFADGDLLYSRKIQVEWAGGVPGLDTILHTDEGDDGGTGWEVDDTFQVTGDGDGLHIGKVIEIDNGGSSGVGEVTAVQSVQLGTLYHVGHGIEALGGGGIDLKVSIATVTDHSQVEVSTDAIRFTVTDIEQGKSSQLKASVQQCVVDGTDMIEHSLKIDNLADDEVSDVLDNYDFARVGNITVGSNRTGSLYLTSDDLSSPFMDIIDGVASWNMFFGVVDTNFVKNGNLDDLGNMDDGSTLYQGANDLPYWTIEDEGSGGIKAHHSGGINNGPYIEIIDGYWQNTHIKQVFDVSGPAFIEGVYYEIRWFAKLGTATVSTVAFWNESCDHWLQLDGNFSEADSIQQWDTFCPGTLGTEWKECKWTFLADAEVEANTGFSLAFYNNGGEASTSFVDNISIRPLNKTKGRIGNLAGVGFSGYGLWSDNVFLEGRIHANSGYFGDVDNGWNIDAYGLANISNNSYIKAGNASGYEGGGFYVDGSGKMSLGSPSALGSYLSYDPSEGLTLGGAIRVTDSAGYDYRDAFGIMTPKTFHLESAGGPSGDALLTDESTGDVYTHDTRGYIVYLWDQETYKFAITDSNLITIIQTEGSITAPEEFVDHLSTEYDVEEGWIWFDTYYSGPSASGHNSWESAATDMATFLNAIPTDTIVVILTADEPSRHVSVYGGSNGDYQELSDEGVALRNALTRVGAHYTEDEDSTYDDDGKIENAGAAYMHGIDNLRHRGSYILVGRKKENSHTDASEFVGLQHADDEGDETNPVRIKLKVTGSKVTGNSNSSIDIIDVQNSAIMDLDSVEAKSFEYSRSDGYKIKAYEHTDSQAEARTYLIFTVPHIRDEDRQHVEIFMSSMNYNGEDGIVALYMNGTLIAAVDNDSLGAGRPEYGNYVVVNDTFPKTGVEIPDSLWNSTPGSVNVFDFRAFTNEDRLTIWIYQFKIMDKRTGKVYDNGYSGGDYPLANNILANYSFEQSVTQQYTHTENFTGWKAALYGSSQIHIQETSPRSGLKHLTGIYDGGACNFYNSTDVSMDANSTYRLKYFYRFPINSDAQGVSFRVYDQTNSWRCTDDSWQTGTEEYNYLWETGSPIAGGPFVHHNSGEAPAYNNDDETYDMWHTAEWFISTVSPRPSVTILFMVNGTGTLLVDEITFIKKSATHNPGLYQTPEKLGYYNGVGGDGGWVNYMSDNGKIFFGHPYDAANFANPSAGGSYIAYNPAIGKIEINANMIAGKIESQDSKTFFDLDDDKIVVHEDNIDRVVIGKIS